MPVSRTTGIAIALGVLVLGAAAYLLLRPSQQEGLTGTGAPASAAELKFLSLTAKIDPVTLDTSIFSDPRFTGLVDIRTAVLPEPAGRVDPFAPLTGAPR